VIMRNKLIGIVASVAMALIGTGLLVFYVRGSDDDGSTSQGSVQVLVVSTPIPKGTKAEELTGKVRLEAVPANVAAPGALSSLTSLDGQVTLVDLGSGDQLAPSRFGPPAVTAAPGVPPGLLQVTLPIDKVRAVGGQLRAGDLVGVVASFDDPATSRMILQKVKVTGVRTAEGVSVKSEAQGNAPTSTLLHVTLALDAAQVERVVFAAEYGRLWLSAEPANAPATPTKLQTKASVNA
jgi:pilus assembly protein CpaB